MPVDAELAAVLRTCAVRRPWAEQDEGPYHRDEPPDRRDVTEDRIGVPLQLGIRLADAGGVPAHDAIVEIWHCDALGRYSGFPPPDADAAVSAKTAPRAAYEPERIFLRGCQRTDGAGMVEFRTIYPGWYPGRTVHIHVMVRVADASFTSQLYFPESVTDAVFAQLPYAERPGRDTTNADDGIFPTGGEPAVLDVASTPDAQRAALCLVLPAVPA